MDEKPDSCAKSPVTVDVSRFSSIQDFLSGDARQGVTVCTTGFAFPRTTEVLEH